MKVRDVLARLTQDGWSEIRSNSGDHRQFKHAAHPQKVTVDGKPNMDVPIGTLRNIFRQAGWPWQTRR